MAEQPTDPRIIEQSLRKGEVEIKKLAVETRAASMTAVSSILPKELPVGSVDAGSAASPIGVAASYRSLDGIASDLARRVPSAVNKIWVVPSDVVTRYRAVHDVVTSALERSNRELRDASALLDEPADAEVRAALTFIPALGLAAAFAGSALPVISSLLRRNTTVRSQDLTMSFTAVAAAVAERLRDGRQVTVHGVPGPAPSSLSQQVRDLEQARDELAKKLVEYRANHVDEQNANVAVTAEQVASYRLLVAECAKEKDLQKLEPALHELEKAAKAASEAREDVSDRTARVSHADKVVEEVSAVLASIRTADTTGVTPIEIAAVYEANKDSAVLLLDASYAGAESVYEEIPMKKDRALHHGTAVVSFFLIGGDGTLTDSGAIHASAAANTTVGKADIEWGNLSLSPSRRDEGEVR
jgi:cytochrome c551/c552